MAAQIIIKNRIPFLMAGVPVTIVPVTAQMLFTLALGKEGPCDLLRQVGVAPGASYGKSRAYEQGYSNHPKLLQLNGPDTRNGPTQVHSADAQENSRRFVPVSLSGAQHIEPAGRIR
ncbi:hypothetical protein MCOR16_001938 [Pyricularia oryzae]|nr:hypothetical protein MCOR15_010800 [Pyricularia oryzae]KAI6537905.1 hypothetical protein MCOR16_001938 [Pyricularia oryzae]